MNMGKKVYVVVETWDDEYNNIRAVFTDEQAARDFVDSKEGDWGYYALDLDVEKPDIEMRLWRVSLDISGKRYGELNNTTQSLDYGYPRKENAFFFTHDKYTPFFVADVMADRKSKAMQAAKSMRDEVLANPDRFPDWQKIVSASTWYNIGARYDFNTGHKIEEDEK